MISMRLRRVVTLTIITLLMLRKTTKVAARVSGTEEFQNGGVDTLPLAEQHHPRRRWPARLLGSFTSPSVFTRFARTPLKAWLFPHLFLQGATDRQKAVTVLFRSHNFEELNADRFFLSKQFTTWEEQVKKAYGAKSDELMVTTMQNELKENANGQVEVMIARAFENDNLKELALRLEDILLQKLVNVVLHTGASPYVRYVLYRGPAQNSVNEKMQKLLEPKPDPDWFTAIENNLFNPRDSFMRFEEPAFRSLSFFLLSITGRLVEHVFENLAPVDGFNNNAFLLDLLYNKAAARYADVDFIKYMLATTKEWRHVEYSKVFNRLDEKELPYDLQNKLVKPIREAITKDAHKSEVMIGDFLLVAEKTGPVMIEKAALVIKAQGLQANTSHF